MFQQLVLFQLGILDCFEGYSVRFFFSRLNREKRKRVSQATEISSDTILFPFWVKGSKQSEKPPAEGWLQIHILTTQTQYSSYLRWEYLPTTLHPSPRAVLFFSFPFFSFFNGMTLLLFQGSGLFLIRSVPWWDLGAVAEWQTEGKIKNQNSTKRDLSTGRIQFWMSLVHRLEKKHDAE